MSYDFALAMRLHVMNRRARTGAFLCQGCCCVHTHVPRLFCDLLLPCPSRELPNSATYTEFDNWCGSGACVYLFQSLLTPLGYKLLPDCVYNCRNCLPLLSS